MNVESLTALGAKVSLILIHHMANRTLNHFHTFLLLGATLHAYSLVDTYVNYTTQTKCMNRAINPHSGTTLLSLMQLDDDGSMVAGELLLISQNQLIIWEKVPC